MPKTIQKLIIALLLLAAPTGAPAPQLVDAVIATVGNEAILFSEIEFQMRSVRETLRAQTDLTHAAREAEYQDEFERLLNEAIEAKLLYREAEKVEATIPNSALEEYMQNFRGQFDTDEEYFTQLRRAGYTVSEFRESQRRLLIARWMGQSKREALQNEVTVSQNEIQEYYEEHNSDYVRPERVYVRQIMIQASRDSEERAEARELLAGLRDQARAGADFAELARQHSQAPGAEEGGILGWAEPGTFVDEVDEILFTMPVGGISDPIENQFGVLIFKVEQREEESTPNARDINALIEPILKARAVDERYKKWMQDLRRRNRVRIFW